MSIAITEDHKALAETASEFLQKRDARGAARSLLEADSEELPDLWRAITDLGWQGLHIAEEHGGSGYGLEELVVVVEELGRVVAPGPFVPSAIASAVIADAGDDATKKGLLPGFADGSTVAGVALNGSVSVSGGTA
jgi:alkylation response protein AidB-like acyl-CoA dehydrogenase